VSRGDGRQRARHNRATGQHEAVPGLPLAGNKPERQLDQASDEHRNRDQQPDLRVAQPEIGADQRQRGALGTVCELVDELDRQRNGDGCEAQESAMSEAANTKRTQAAEQPARAGFGVSDRSTSHDLIVTAGNREPNRTSHESQRTRTG